MFETLIPKLSNQARLNKLTRMAALQVWAVYNVRIFEKGLNSENVKIGDYTNKAYKDLRRKKGREVNFVNLEFTQMMRKDYQPTRSSDVVAYGFTSTAQAAKAQWNEERYGIVFDLTEGERKLFIETLEKLIFEK